MQFEINLDKISQAIKQLRIDNFHTCAEEVKRLFYYYLYTANLSPSSEEAFEHWIKTGEGNVNNSNHT